jgi:D-glycero-alpha-D-manno-heptose-7-phosphate kinase
VCDTTWIVTDAPSSLRRVSAVTVVFVQVSSPSAAPARTVVVRAPTRIDLGGGWTDVPPYCDEQGGFVCNFAIARYAFATVTVDETYPHSPAASGADGTDPLIVAALRRSGARGLRVTLESDFPVGAGLGGSSAASAAVLGALAAFRRQRWDRAAIAEEGRRIEVEELGVAGGRQDHYAATHGGALALTFTETVAVRRIQLTEETISALERRALLVYTGESRISGETIRGVLDAYGARDDKVCNALTAMKSLAGRMVDALEHGDLSALGAFLAEHWVHQRSLHPAIPTPRIDEIVARAEKAGALGWKAMGASGGGCVLVLAGDGNVDQVRDAVAPLGSFVPWTFDRDGLSIKP